VHLWCWTYSHIFSNLHLTLHTTLYFVASRLLKKFGRSPSRRAKRKGGLGEGIFARLLSRKAGLGAETLSGIVAHKVTIKS